MVKTKTISSKLGNETRVSTFSTLTQHSLEIPGAIRKEEEMKGIQI
jgi:hypothetical protein